MNKGRRIYYDISSGNIILDTGEHSGSVVETTIEQDFASYSPLAERVPSSVGCIELPFGKFRQDFETCNGYRVNIGTTPPSLSFSYPYPSEPESPPVYRAPLSEEVEALKAQNSEIIFTLVMNDLM